VQRGRGEEGGKREGEKEEMGEGGEGRKGRWKMEDGKKGDR
jgi:hypothetical protein